ncbi:MAG: 3-hydroxyisobutyrate dehydrogenase-like protein [Pseudomonas sp.]|nr:3-hydroxyisobutyrate dehydrogenase-like protein [Pseudomonas sp.]
MTRAGFIGLGDMGGAIARRIIDAGFPTTLWARREASLEPFRDTSFASAPTPRDLGQSSDIVGLCVFGDDDVRAVALGPNGVLAGMSVGSILIIHSTISVDATLEISLAAEAKGVCVLDAPVSGARNGAVTGKLTIMAGGDPAAFDKALPFMSAYGASIFYLGPTGSGQKMKVLNNVLGFANLRMASLALELGAQLGLEPQSVQSILRSGSAGSFNLNILLDRLLPDPAFARHAVTMTEKDTRLYQAVCKSAGLGRSLMDQVAEEAIDVVAALGQRAS